MNYFPFHIGDYVSATRHLSWAEDCAFRRLLDTYYVSEKPLPSDWRQVCRLVLATTDEQREAVRVVLSEFFKLTDAGWVNSRADAEIAAMRDKQQKQRDKANKRWHKQEAEPGNAPAMPLHEESDAAASKSDADAMPPTPTPTPTPIPPIAPKGADDPPGFVAFWASWPQSVRKVDRKKCAEKWRRKGFEQLAETIAAHVEAMKTTKQWRDGFEPAPMTYLNGERWADGIDQGELTPEGFL